MAKHQYHKGGKMPMKKHKMPGGKMMSEKEMMRLRRRKK